MSNSTRERIRTRIRQRQQARTSAPDPAGDWRELVVYRDSSTHPTQQAFIESLTKFIVVRAGRRGGKTVGMAQKAAKRFVRGQRVLYATPTAEQIERFWYEIKVALDEPLKRGLLYKNETEHIIEVPGTLNRIRAKTAWNADTLRGDYGDFLIFDEWQLMNEEAWDRVGAPMLIDNDGDAAFVYTPPSLATRSVTKARDPLHASKMFKRAAADTSGFWETFHFTSRDNPFVSAEAIERLASTMTRLSYQQEILAEDDVDVPGALWKQANLDALRVDHAPEMRRIVVAIDPMGESGSLSSEAGIVVSGLGVDGHFYILEDLSLNATPDGWARVAVEAYERWSADRIIAEKNYGGEMVESTVRTVDKNVPLTLVTATRGKLVRAEPIAALYEQGRAHHVGEFPLLEGELTSYAGAGRSPNRLDAMVWGGVELMLNVPAEIRHGFVPDALAQYRG